MKYAVKLLILVLKYTLQKYSVQVLKALDLQVSWLLGLSDDALWLFCSLHSV